VTAAARDRAIVFAAVLVAIALSWFWIVPMAVDMYGPMTGPSAWMMTRVWTPTHVALLWAMWAVMMVGMMLPSALPTMLLFTAAVRRSPGRPGSPAVRTIVFGAGYLAAWGGFSAAATLLQRWLSQQLILNPMMEIPHARAGGVLLIIAGLYQWTPLKQACLHTCRSPLSFLTRYWRPGASGAFRMGLAHGLHCLGCCWALMLLLFVGGVMNLWVIAALTIFVLAEKLAPLGAQGGRLSGVALCGLGLWMIVR
jgi:predicted metal-binding membrane protein